MALWTHGIDNHCAELLVQELRAGRMTKEQAVAQAGELGVVEAFNWWLEVSDDEQEGKKK